MTMSQPNKIIIGSCTACNYSTGRMINYIYCHKLGKEIITPSQGLHRLCPMKNKTEILTWEERNEGNENN